MIRAVAVKLVTLAGVALAVSVLTFGAQFLLEGDPVCVRLGERCGDEQAYAAVEAELGLDQPVATRFSGWLGDALSGDLGQAFSNGRATTDIIGAALPVSLRVVVMAQVFALAVAVPVAVMGAYRKGSWLDRALTAGSFTVIAVPVFVMAPLLIYLLAVQLGWLPTQYQPPRRVGEAASLQSLLMPALALAAGLGATYARVLRADVLATLQEDYVLMARSQGLHPRRILFRHALRPSCFTLLTTVGLSSGALIGGTVIMERLFSIPGVGSQLIDAISRRDYDVVQGIVLVIAVAYVAINFVVDLLYTALDPRLRRAR
jgi:peptide/nickel transport system permease protein